MPRSKSPDESGWIPLQPPKSWMKAIKVALIAGAVLLGFGLVSGRVSVTVAAGLATTVIGLIGREVNSGHPNNRVIVAVWMIGLAASVPLFPDAALVALAVPLATAMFLTVLMLDDRDHRRFTAAGFLVLVWQIGWLIGRGMSPWVAALSLVIVAAGIVAGVMVVRAARDAIRAGQDTYMSLFNGVPVGLFRSDREGNILAANMRLATILGFSDINELLATNAKELYDDVRDRDQALESIESGGHDEVLYRMKRIDGTPIWVRETASAITDESGTVVSYEGALEDVTHRTEAESAVKRAEAKFEILFDAAPIGMVLADMTGTFLRVNKAFSELLGRPVEELTGANWRDLTAPEDEERSAEPVHRMNVGDTLDYERRFFPASGETRWGHIRMSMFEEEPDSVPRLVVQIADITAQKELQHNLEQAVRSKDEFIAAVSHELRTPLTAVVGLTRELADSRSFSDEERHELLELVADQSADVASIVEDLLVAARADMGVLTISKEKVDIHLQLEISIEDCSHLAGSKPVSVDGARTPAMALADASRVRQIVRNLLTNAFRYGGDRIEAKVLADGGTVALRVSDNGGGLPSEEWERIFEPYHRAERSDTVVGSIGLGLAVSRRLAAAMDGELSYRYEAGHSIFELTLPAAG